MERNSSPFSNYYKHKTKKKKLKLKKNALDKVDFEEEKKNDPKYKTELCKSFMENNFCQYGNKCRFAHGEDELVIKDKISNYKKKLCKSFFNDGFCPYGIRCNFQHDQRKYTEIKLPFYFINLLIYRKPKLNTGKRLKIFEEITNTENVLSESTLSCSIDNSPNSKEKNNIKYYIGNNFSEILENGNIKNTYFDINFKYNKRYQKEEEIENNIINNSQDKIEKSIYNYFLDCINECECDCGFDKSDKD